VEETIEELHADGEDAISLEDTTLQVALMENTYVFVDFFANWCSHCRDLAPTWETFAEVMYIAAEHRVDSQLENDPNHPGHTYSETEYDEAVKVELPVFIGKIDCVDHADLCLRYNIQAYPTLKFFVDGKEVGDYRGHRTVLELTHFISDMEKEHKGKNGAIKAEGAADCEFFLSWGRYQVLFTHLSPFPHHIIVLKSLQNVPFKPQNTKSSLAPSPPVGTVLNIPGTTKTIQAA
jgi:thiol-disulfide isomerase/thioredoxin